MIKNRAQACEKQIVLDQNTQTFAWSTKDEFVLNPVADLFIWNPGGSKICNCHILSILTLIIEKKLWSFDTNLYSRKKFH